MRVLIALALVVVSFCASPSWAAVALDACTQNTYQGGSSSYSFNHTVAAGSNRFLIVAVSSAVAVSDVTIGGVSVASTINSQSSPTAGRAVVAYRVAPAEGVVSIGITLASSNNSIARACSFTGVDQTTPVGTIVKSANNDATTSIENTVTSSATGMTFDSLYFSVDVTVLAADGGQANSSWVQGPASADQASSTEVGAASVTMRWTWTSNFTERAQIVVPISPAALTNPMKSRKKVAF